MKERALQVVKRERDRGEKVNGEGKRRKEISGERRDDKNRRQEKEESIL